MSPSDSQRFSFEETAHLGGRTGPHSYSRLQTFFLLRLTSLLERRGAAKDLSPDDWRLKLLNKAIYSTFCDCTEQGVADDARKLFAQTRARNSA